MKTNRIELFKVELAELLKKYDAEISYATDYSMREDGSNIGMPRHWTELGVSITVYEPFEKEIFTHKLNFGTLSRDKEDRDDYNRWLNLFSATT